MTLRSPDSARSLTSRPVIRLAVGSLQGTLLSLLTLAVVRHAAPFDRPESTLPVERLLLALPVSFLLVWGRMRLQMIAVLLGIIAAITLAVSHHEIHQEPPSALSLPDRSLHHFLFHPLLFILIALAVAAESDRRLWPRYPRLFEAAWDLAVLLALAALFIVLSWGVLWLMAALFAVIGLHGFVRLLGKPWIWPLMNCAAFSATIAFCIEGDWLVAGARRLALALFGLLLPILSGLTAVFLVSLIFVPLSRLWSTHHSGLLLTLSALLLILLLNAVYQDGRGPTATPMRLAGRLAAIEILPLVILAVAALALRVHDHGWSVERVVSAGGFSILVLYGLGYFGAALAPGRWLCIIEPVNVGTAVWTILVIVSLLTSVADPSRISVASQVARLRSGAIPAEKFDYAFLAREGGRYGRAALASLVDHPPPKDAASVHDRAVAALSGITRPDGRPTPSDLAARISVHPTGAILPKDLLS